MGFGIGEAIAMGIAQGVGDGANKVLANKRQDRLAAEEDKKIDARFDKQRKAQMEDWTKQTEVTTRARRDEYAISRKDTLADQQTNFTQQKAMEITRQRFARSQVAAQTQEAKNLSLFNANLKYIESNVNKAQTFQTLAKLPPAAVAKQLALTAIKGVPKEFQREAYQDFLKRSSNMTTGEMLAQAGVIPDDLTPYSNDPQYKQAIPKGFVAGLGTDGSAMDQVFKYEAPAVPEVDPKAPASIQLMAKRTEGYSSMITNSPILMSRGINPVAVDSEVLNLLDTDLGQGDKAPSYVDQASGLEVNRVEDRIIRGLQNKTLVMDAEGRIMTKNGALREGVKMAAMDGFNATQPPSMLARPGAGGAANEGIQNQQPQAGMTMDPSQLLAGVPTGQEAVSENMNYRRDKAEFKEYEQQATHISDEVAKSGVITMTESAQRAKAAVKGATPEVKKELYSLIAASNGNFAEAARALEKRGNPNASAAYGILQDLQATQNARILTLGGKAVSEQEAKRFARELGQAGIMGSEKELMRGLSNIQKMGRDEVAANLEGKPQEAKDIYFKTAPIVSGLMSEHDVYGSPEGRAKVAERKQAKAEAMELINQGESPAEVDEYLKEKYGYTINDFED